MTRKNQFADAFGIKNVISELNTSEGSIINEIQ